jgi:hypothetical protein
MCPLSYSFCATTMVFKTENPSLRDASCCKVEVVNGAAGVLLPGFFSMALTLNSASETCFKNFSASASVLKLAGRSALNAAFLPFLSVTKNQAATLKEPVD